MSLLLDALNKADEERKRGDGPPTIDSHHNEFGVETKRKIPTALVILFVIITLAGLLAAVYWLGKKTQAPTQTNITASVSTPTQSVSIEPPLAPPQSTQPDKHLPTAEMSAYNNDSEHNMPEQKTVPEPIPEEQSVATLYQQQTNDKLPAPQSQDMPSQAEQNTNAPNSIKQFANIPEIQDLPNDILNNLPSLKYTEHHYNNNGGSVVINGLVKHANEELAQGLVIDKILEDGIILHIGNYSFKMRALNTWVNM
jgi:general secretion pathway protein B